jgi:hypothetical protein
MPTTYTVVHHADIPSLREGRQGKLDRMFSVRLEPGVVTTVFVDAESYTDAKLDDAVRKYVEDRGRLVGKPRTI